MQLTAEEQDELYELLTPYLEDEQVRSMANFTQHGNVNTLEHCLNVARASWWIAKHFKLRVNEKALATGALLHDFYLYDWHGAGWRHSYRHAKTAMENAVQHFDIDEATQKVILTHMWPISITQLPNSREAFIVTLADKYVSLKETLFCRGERSCS